MLTCCGVGGQVHFGPPVDWVMPHARFDNDLVKLLIAEEEGDHATVAEITAKSDGKTVRSRRPTHCRHRRALTHGGPRLP